VNVQVERAFRPMCWSALVVGKTSNALCAGGQQNAGKKALGTDGSLRSLEHLDSQIDCWHFEDDDARTRALQSLNQGRHRSKCHQFG
jgi:hypothetical protein